MKYQNVNDTVFFHFALNDNTGAGNDGSALSFVVRKCGDTGSAAPVFSGTPTLLSHVSYPAGCYETEFVASIANGFEAGEQYAVFSTATVSAVNPTGLVGEFVLAPVISNVVEVLGETPTEITGGIPADVQAWNSQSVNNLISGRVDAAAVNPAGADLATLAQCIKLLAAVYDTATGSGGNTLTLSNGAVQTINLSTGTRTTV